MNQAQWKEVSAKTPVFELFIEFPSSDSHHTVQIPTQLLR